MKSYVEKCPVCGKETLENTIEEKDIPYFGKSIIITSSCSSCGYRHTDVILLEQKDPVRMEIKVSGEEDLKIRVIRSPYAKIKIPEIGVEIDPVVMGESFVSDVEGLFLRILNIMVQLLRDSRNEDKEKIIERMKKIARMRNGLETLTIIIEDPSGNSAIVSEKTKIERIME